MVHPINYWLEREFRRQKLLSARRFHSIFFSSNPKREFRRCIGNLTFAIFCPSILEKLIVPCCMYNRTQRQRRMQSNEKLINLVVTAISSGALELLQAYSARGIKVDFVKSSDKSNAVHCAAYKDQAKVISFLREVGADINAVDINGRTPTFVAAQLGHVWQF